MVEIIYYLVWLLSLGDWSYCWTRLSFYLHWYCFPKKLSTLSCWSWFEGLIILRRCVRRCPSFFLLLEWENEPRREICLPASSDLEIGNGFGSSVIRISTFISRKPICFKWWKGSKAPWVTRASHDSASCLCQLYPPSALPLHWLLYVSPQPRDVQALFLFFFVCWSK